MDTAVTTAIAHYGRRVADLVRSAERPNAVAVGEWNVDEVAVHLSLSLDAITSMARGGGSVISEISSLAMLTKILVKGEEERDLRAIAGRIEASTATLVELLEAETSEEPRPWLVEGIEMPPSTIGCHALNELVVHGYDMATAQGVPWPIDREHASLVVMRFLFPVAGALGRDLVDQKVAAGLRASMEIKLRGGGGSAFFNFNDGELSIEPAPTQPVVCHISVDPAAFLLVAWGRRNQWRAIARGQLVAYGRKPWLGLKLRSLMINP